MKCDRQIIIIPTPRTTTTMSTSTSSCKSSSGSSSRRRASSSSVNSRSHEPDSLLDLSAKVVAFHIPFARIEEKHDRIPEPVQNRIIFWSFPRNERDICMYSTLSTISSNGSVTSYVGDPSSTSSSSTTSPPAQSCSGCVSSPELKQLPFYRGLKLYEHGGVDNVLQVGFHLSGTVYSSWKVALSAASSSSSQSQAASSSTNNSNNNQSSLGNASSSSVVSSFLSSTTTTSSSSSSSTEDKKCRVSITFDRCKITSVTCSCGAKDIFWCQHVVALALYRIRNPTLVKLRVPISGEICLYMNCDKVKDKE